MAPVKDFDSPAPTTGKKVPTGKLTAWICGQTRLAADATDLLKELRARKAGGATVVGVLRTEPGSDDYNHRIPGATLQLLRDGAASSTQTDFAGAYRFDGVPDGKYQFEVKLPPEFEVAPDKMAALPSITIGGQPCYEKDIFARPTAHFEGP